MEFRPIIRPLPWRSRHGFTLVEMLVVMAIIGVLTGVVAPAFRSLQQGADTSFASQAISDEIAVARELAASRNLPVEVRFISPLTWASQGSPAYTGFHAVQLWGPNSAGTAMPIDRTQTLPEGIEISFSAKFSPLLATLAATDFQKTALPPGPVTGSFVSFFVRPDGSIQVPNPPSDAAGASQDDASGRAPSYFLTILPVRYDAAATLPANFSTLQINPDTGRTQIYRP